MSEGEGEMEGEMSLDGVNGGEETLPREPIMLCFSELSSQTGGNERLFTQSHMSADAALWWLNHE